MFTRFMISKAFSGFSRRAIRIFSRSVIGVPCVSIGTRCADRLQRVRSLDDLRFGSKAKKLAMSICFPRRPDSGQASNVYEPSLLRLNVRPHARIFGPLLPQQSRTGKAERDHDRSARQQGRQLADVLNAKSVGDRTHGLAHEKEKGM